MTRWAAARQELRRKWGAGALVMLVAALGLYGWGVRTERIGGRSGPGRALGYAGLLITAIAASYGARKRLGEQALREGVARLDLGRAGRLVAMRSRVGALHASQGGGGLSAAQLRAAALAEVKESGFEDSVEVTTVTDDDGKAHVRLQPRLLAGRRENLLAGHQYLGLLVPVLTYLHHPLKLKEPFGVVVGCLALGTVVSGIVASSLYLMVPRVLLRLETSSRPLVPPQILVALLRHWTTVHGLVAASFVLVLATHILASW